VLPLIGGRSHDAPLTPLGEQQAQTLGRFLRTYTTLRFDAIYSSPIERSMQTASIVCEVSRRKHHRHTQKKKDKRRKGREKKEKKRIP